MRKITMEEVGKHTTRDDLWIVINKEVLDVTKFLKDVKSNESLARN